ncbi:cyclophilin-like fold protein [Arthrobacter globiformis]|uniref:Cyclophilin-like domain-containing protein n=1 Tax=Arthrobacter globiformis TaxID=1665 RepID=A0A328HFD5_ARTGO|nr:cyclophilin-like fold protein [Arthrobacter globiformis]RAM37358.1 hypothetical protein DBZ45_11165 [Arthrobacter globiformis]
MTAMPQRTAAVSIAILLSMGLAACMQPSAQGPGDSSAAPSSAAAPSGSSSAAGSSSTSGSSSADDDREGTHIRIRIGNQTLDATVWDTPAGRDLLTQLPRTLSFRDLNGEEKVGHLEQSLTMNGMPQGDDPRVGDLGWYAPWGNVVLYYGDVRYWDGIARIGRIHGDLSAISGRAEDFTATLEAAG